MSVSDIVNNLTTNAANKPLSAAQGVVLAGRIETVRQITDEIERELTDKLAADELPEAIENALAQAKESGEFDGAAGPQGNPGPAGADGPPGADYVLTDADRQEIAKIAAGLVEVPGGGGTEATKWSEEKIFTLEEDAAIIDIDLGGEYDEVIFVVVYYKASSATASANAYAGVGLEDGEIVDIVAGKTESGDGLKWDFHRLHCCKQGNGRMLTATTQGSVTPNSVYCGYATYPYRDYRIVSSGSSAKITSIIMRTWVDGALFGAGTKVFYIMR